jgi:hypothetical protein
MRDDVPMSFDQYNTSGNPFAAASNALGKVSAGGMHLRHAMVLNQLHHEGVMRHLERQHELGEIAAESAHSRSEEAANAGHGRALELHKTFHGSAEAGTPIQVSLGNGVSASYTKEKPKEKQQPVPVAPVVPTEKPKKYAHRNERGTITGYHDTPQVPLTPKKKASSKKKK